MAPANGERGTRPIRIANCSGYMGCPSHQMHRQAVGGPVDVITGDYLAEMNLAANAEAYRKGEHPGYEPSARDGLLQSLPVLNEKRIKVVINGGSQNPKGLAELVLAEANKHNYNLSIAYITGDDLYPRLPELLNSSTQLKHLDSDNPAVKLAANATRFLEEKEKPVVGANAYLGARGIRQALQQGADIVICGRVADASPVMGAAMWWFDIPDDAFDTLAGTLLAGHLIECSNYATGGNFCGFTEYPLETFVGVDFPIAEISRDGSCVITVHDGYKALINKDVIRCQILYELQGNVYLNSDVTADWKEVEVVDLPENRVRVSGARGQPPPETTKLALLYLDGYQCEFPLNAAGWGVEKKFDLLEMQLKALLKKYQILGKLDVLEFQRIGTFEANPSSQFRGTSYLRLFAQASHEMTLGIFGKAFIDIALQHFSGYHSTLDFRTLKPRPFLAFYPALVPQASLDETVHFLTPTKSKTTELKPGPPRIFAPVPARESYEPTNPVPPENFGPTVTTELGEIAYARSGDKGGNVNIGIFPRSFSTYSGSSSRMSINESEAWDWLRSFLTIPRFQKLMGEDWREWYHIERVEFPKMRAVHFVVYGALSRGVSSSSLLDGLGKGFADYIRAKWVPVPTKFLLGEEKRIREKL